MEEAVRIVSIAFIATLYGALWYLAYVFWKYRLYPLLAVALMPVVFYTVIFAMWLLK